MKRAFRNVSIIAVATCLTGCPAKYREDLDFPYNVEQTLVLEEVQSDRLIQFESVQWDPDNNAELRAMIVDDMIASGRDVLEIGTGTGLISILCLLHSATNVVATDTNPVAVANAIYNAATQEVDDQLSVRQAEPKSNGAFAEIQATEKFDLIIRNAGRDTADESNRKAVRLFLDQLPRHLKAGGRCIAFCFHADQIKHWQSETKTRGFEFAILGDRDLNSITGEVFPAAMLEIRISVERLNEIE